MGKRHDDVDNSLRIMDFHINFDIGLPVELGPGGPEPFERLQRIGDG